MRCPAGKVSPDKEVSSAHIKHHLLQLASFLFDKHVACTNSCTIFSHFSLHQYSTSDGSELVCRLYPSLIFSHFYIKVGQCVWRCQMSLAGLTGFRRQTPYRALACSILPAPFSLLSSFTWLQINCSISVAQLQKAPKPHICLLNQFIRNLLTGLTNVLKASRGSSWCEMMSGSSPCRFDSNKRAAWWFTGLSFCWQSSGCKNRLSHRNLLDGQSSVP